MEGRGSAEENPVFSESLALRRWMDFMLSSIKLLGIGNSLLRDGRETSEPPNKVRVLTLLSVKLKST